jgi:hypothetical protein
MQNLFSGLKEDNERLAEELRKMMEDNSVLSKSAEWGKETIA